MRRRPEQPAVLLPRLAGITCALAVIAVGLTATTGASAAPHIPEVTVEEAVVAVGSVVTATSTISGCLGDGTVDPADPSAPQVALTVTGPGESQPLVLDGTSVGFTAGFSPDGDSHRATFVVPAEALPVPGTYTVRSTGSGAPCYPDDAAETGSAPVEVVVANLPGPPTSVDAVAGPGSALLTWLAPPDDGGTAITGYSIEASTDEGISWEVVGPEQDSVTTNRTITGLNAGTGYLFRVSTVTGAGVSSPSDPSSRVVPSAATSLSIVADPTGTGFRVVVDAGEPSAISGTVTATVDGSVIDTAEVVAGVATVELTNLTPGRYPLILSYSGTATIAPATLGPGGEPPILRVGTSGTPTANGWYRTAVEQTWSCTAGSAAIVSCPIAQSSSSDGVHGATRGIAVAADGGVAVLRSPVVRIDRVRPSVTLTGPLPGARYRGGAPVSRCRAGDSTSGVAGCRVTLRRLAARPQLITWRATATATDRAGLISTRSVDYRVTAPGVTMADTAVFDGLHQVVVGERRRLIIRVDGSSPPVLLRPVRSDAAGRGTPGTPMARATRRPDGTWQVGLPITEKMGASLYWVIGVRVGSGPQASPTTRLRLLVTR